MRFVAPPISELRLRRYHRWMLLWLKWFAAFLDAASRFAPLSEQATTIAHQWLDRIERVLVNIVIIRTAPFVRAVNRPRRAGRPLTEDQIRRAVIGAAMRKSLRTRDLRRRIAALSQDPGDLAARLLQRLPRGLTRRRPIITCPEMRPIWRAQNYVSAARPADTS